MSSQQDIKLSTFPASLSEALAFQYVKSQNLEGKSPAEIHTMYWEAYYEIAKDYRGKANSGWFSLKREEYLKD